MIGHQLSHVAYTRQPFHHNRIDKFNIFYAKNQGLFHSASEARALLYLPYGSSGENLAGLLIMARPLQRGQISFKVY
jgi:hypothetical protein